MSGKLKPQEKRIPLAQKELPETLKFPEGTGFQKLRGPGGNYRLFKTQSTKDVETSKLKRFIKPSEEMVGRLGLENF